MNPYLHNPTKAAKLLGVSLNDITRETVHSAFTQKAKAASGSAEQGKLVRAAQNARDALVAYLEERGLP